MDDDKIIGKILDWYEQDGSPKIFFLGDYLVCMTGRKGLVAGEGVFRAKAGVVDTNQNCLVWETPPIYISPWRLTYPNRDDISETISWCRDVRKRIARREVEQHLQNG